MITWQDLPGGTTMALAGAAVVLGVSLTSSPASAQETIACVSNKLGLVRIVEDESQCKFWEHAETIGGGDGSDVKFVFVTSTEYRGDINLQGQSCQPGFDCSTGIGRARSECNRLAGAVGLPGEYEPWLSDSTSDAVVRFTDLGADGPWFNVKGELVAGSLAGLLTLKNGTDYLYNAVRYSELGVDLLDTNNAFVWTGTLVTGEASMYLCVDWTESEDSDEGGGDGSAPSITAGWTGSDFSFSPCPHGLHLYCFQQ